MRIIKDKTYSGLLSLRKTTSSNKNFVDLYMKSNNKKFCQQYPGWQNEPTPHHDQQS